MIREQCSCGASIVTDDGDGITPEGIADWRANHRHDKPLSRGLSPTATIWDEVAVLMSESSGHDDPPCPFPMGAKVTRNDHPEMGEYVVDDWDFVGCRGRWEVIAISEDSNRGLSMPPEELSLVPDPPAASTVTCDKCDGDGVLLDEAPPPISIPTDAASTDEPPDESVAVFSDSDGDLIPMKRFDEWWYGRDPDDKATWVECVRQLGQPIAVHMPGAVPALTPEQVRALQDAANSSVRGYDLGRADGILLGREAAARDLEAKRVPPQRKYLTIAEAAATARGERGE